jgi:hypothetical protein
MFQFQCFTISVLYECNIFNVLLKELSEMATRNRMVIFENCTYYIQLSIENVRDRDSLVPMNFIINELTIY